jgi:TPR repeat protein
MISKRATACAFITAALLVGAPIAAANADFAAGKAAFERRDYRRAYQELLADAQGGNAEAEYMIGEMTADGLGTGRSYELAARWYALSAAKGYIPANLTLGILYLYGAGTEDEASAIRADPARAAVFLKIAADADDKEAQYLMGQLYMSGDGVPQDLAKASDYTIRAARRGIVGAQYNAGVLALSTGDTAENLIEAYKWFSLAAREHYPGAEQNRKHIATFLSPADLQKAETLVSEFRASD